MATPAVRLRYVVHPNFIWRIACEPADLVSTLTDGATARLLARIVSLRASLADATPHVCAVLERLVPTLDDRRLRRQALALKRDLFGGRPPAWPPDAAFAAAMEPSDGLVIEGLVDGIRELQTLDAAFPRVFASEVSRGEERLADLFRRRNLHDGLSVVVPELYAALQAHYSGTQPRIGNKTERSLDTTFVQYLSRTALKTSPLSSFTAVFVGEWRDDGARTVAVDLPELRLQRRVSLRRSLLMEILAPLVAPALTSGQSRLRLNRSLRQDGSHFVVSRRIESASLQGMTWGVGLEEVRFKATAALATIIGLFERVEPSGVTVAELTGQLDRRIAPAQLDAVVRTLHELVALGVLHSSSQFTEQDDPLAHAAAVLGGAEPVNARLQRLVGALQEDTERYVLEPTGIGRSVTARSIKARLDEIARAGGKTLSGEIARPFIYEDCHVADNGLALSESALADIRDDLEALVAASPIFDMNAGLQCWLASSFVDRFGPDGVCDDPRAFLLAQAKAIDGGVIAPWTVAAVANESTFGKELKSLKDAFFDHVVERIDATGTARIDHAVVQRLVAAIPGPVAVRPRSHCFFGQFFADSDGGRGFALNQILSGNSQLFARFMSGRTEQASRVEGYLRDTSRFGHCLELAGVFGFNANLHPPLTSEQLLVAPYPANRRNGRWHELDRLTLRYDATVHRVYLSDESGRPVDVYYFGLLNPGLIPQLQRILCGLSTQAPIFFAELSRAMRRHRVTPATLSFSSPRVRLGRIVLLRKAWNVPRNSLPVLEHLDQAQTFRAVHEWHREQGLPTRGFVRFLPSEAQLRVAGTAESEVEWAVFDRTKLKPFYIDFSNPLLVRQFTKVCRTARFDLSLQEPLPDIADQHVHVQGRGHVAELQIELSAVPEGCR